MRLELTDEQMVALAPLIAEARSHQTPWNLFAEARRRTYPENSAKMILHFTILDPKRAERVRKAAADA